MTGPVAEATLPERPPISTPRQLHRRDFLEAERARLARQPALGLAGITLVIPVVFVLGVGWGGAERSLLVLGPISTFALPVIAMIAFWWEDWPGTMLRPPLSGLIDTVVVGAGGVALTIAGQAVVGHADVRGVFDPTAVDGHAPTFPGTMPIAGAIFVAMLELTLVLEGWPLRRLGRFAGGAVALAAAWAIGLVLYLALVEFRPLPGSGLHARDGVLSGGEFGAIIVCIGALQVGFYVVLRGWPFAGVSPRAVRLVCSNAAVIAGGWLIYLGLRHGVDLSPVEISAVAGSVVAAGLVVGMLFEGWLDSLLPASTARLADLAAVGLVAALLYVGLRAYAHAVGWTRAEPEEWIAYAALNAIGAGVILHVAVGRRWPFMRTAETGGCA
jgi:hypothetical protein